MKINTGLSVALFFANVMRMTIYLLQLMSGLAAFALSATTSAFVIHHVFPNPYVPIAAGIGLDLAKVTSIFMNRFTLHQSRSSKVLALAWRIALISIAALFTCIAVSGMLLNKNEGMILKEKQDQLTAQYESTLKEEKSNFLQLSQSIEAQKESERKTGIGERYLKLDDELKQATQAYRKRTAELAGRYNQEMSSLAASSFREDRRNNDQLFENFRATINENFAVDTTYTGWILILVIAIAISLETTIYVVFDNLACSILPYVQAMNEQTKVELEHRLKMHSNDMNYERKAEDIILNGVIEEMEDAKNARIVTGKLDNYNLRAQKEIEKQLANVKKGFRQNITDSIKDFLSGTQAEETNNTNI